MEDVWRGEVQDLLSQITQLQAENKRLSVSLSLKESPICEQDQQDQEGGLYLLELFDTCSMNSLTDLGHWCRIRFIWKCTRRNCIRQAAVRSENVFVKLQSYTFNMNTVQFARK